MAIRIKRSMGLQRGGDDHASSIIIAEYAYRFQDKAKLWKPVDSKLLTIKALVKQRERLVTTVKQLEVPIQEIAECHSTKLAHLLQKNQKQIIDKVKQFIDKIEDQIEAMIKDDTQMTKCIEIVTSIKGVGKQTAISLMVYTRGFTIFENAKQLACYCGVAPFNKSSGTSVRSKPKVSHFANKRLKSLLHLCAMAALRHDPEIKAYYLRKQAEGKNKMLIINAIRNKLILRIFALLRDGRHYAEHYAKICA